jgi:raffinose/stachyose/melibiose transport system substrate-binding protein
MRSKKSLYKWGLLMALLLFVFKEQSTVLANNIEQVQKNDEISGKITVWEHSMTFETSMENLIEGFEELYPQTEVSWEIWDMENYYDLISTAIQAGDGPDLFYTDGIARTMMKEYVDKQIILDLSDLIDLQYFDDSALWREQIDGKCYGIPWLTFDSRIVYYNKDMFQENGWEIPDTFDEFEELLETIKSSGIVPISITPHDSYALLFLWEPILTAMYPEYASGLGKGSSDILGDPVKKSIEKMLEWANAGYFGENWSDILNGSDQGMKFVSGKTAMNICGSWDGTSIQSSNPDLNMGYFILPSNENTIGLMGSIASGFSVNAASDNLDTALAFANYCASLEGQERWITPLGGISASEYIESSTESSRNIASEAGGNMYTSWEMVLASISDQAVTVWEKDFLELFSGDLTVEELMSDLAAVME